MRNIVFLYGVLLLVGGFIGYVKAKSKPSLIAGIISSIVIFIALSLQKDGNPVGRYLIVLTSGALTVQFYKRFQATKKFMPSGMLMSLSVIIFILSLFIH